jgi:hypothetical protein
MKRADIAQVGAQLQRFMQNRRVLDAHLKVGDVLTHRRCLGILEEHVFTARDGRWLCGTPTADTCTISGIDEADRAQPVRDISPLNVTHLNRVPLECLGIVAISNNAGGK